MVKAFMMWWSFGFWIFYFKFIEASCADGEEIIFAIKCLALYFKGQSLEYQQYGTQCNVRIQSMKKTRKKFSISKKSGLRTFIFPILGF